MVVPEAREQPFDASQWRNLPGREAHAGRPRGCGNLAKSARVAKLADAHGSGPCAREGMGVQVPPRAPLSPPRDAGKAPNFWFRAFPCVGRSFLSSSESGFADSYGLLSFVTHATLLVLLDKSFGDKGRVVAPITYTDVVVYRQANPVRGVVDCLHPAITPRAWRGPSKRFRNCRGCLADHRLDPCLVGSVLTPVVCRLVGRTLDKRVVADIRLAPWVHSRTR